MLMVFPKVTQLIIDEVRAGRREIILTYAASRSPHFSCAI
jgi:hypothetical protein